MIEGESLAGSEPNSKLVVLSLSLNNKVWLCI